jgi:hypothetical protein
VRKAGVLGWEPKRFARVCPSANVAISAALAVLLASCGGTGTVPTLAQVRNAAMTWYRLSEPPGTQVDSATCSATSHRFKDQAEFSCKAAESYGGSSGKSFGELFIMEPSGRLGRVSSGGNGGSRPTDVPSATSRFHETLNDPNQRASVSCVRNEATPYGTISGPGLFTCKALAYSNKFTVVVDWNADGTLAEDKIEDLQQVASSQPTSGATLSDSSTCSDWNSASTSDKESYGATLQPPSAMSSGAFLGLLNTECQGFAADPSLASSTSLATLVQQLGGQSGSDGSTAPAATEGSTASTPDGSSTTMLGCNEPTPNANYLDNVEVSGTSCAGAVILAVEWEKSKSCQLIRSASTCVIGGFECRASQTQPSQGAPVLAVSCKAAKGEAVNFGEYP